MRTYLTLLVLVLALVATGAAWAAYRAEPAIGGTLMQSSTRVTPGEQVRLEARARDEDTLVGREGVPVSTVTDRVRFSWSASGGRFVSQDPAEREPNRAVWQPPVQPGQYTIIATADDVDPRQGADDPPWQGIAVVTVGNPAPTTGELTVRVDPDRLPADGRSTARVTATLRGRERAGRVVRFTTTLGTISPSQTATNSDGQAFAMLRAPRTGGLGTVAASTGNLVAQAFLEIVPEGGRVPYGPIVSIPVMPGQVLLTASPAGIPADGRSTALVNIIVLDPLGRAVAFQPVYLTATAGRITSYAVTDAYGRAAATLEAPLAAGTAAVSAWSALGSGQTTVQFNPIRVQLSASHHQVPADGKTVVRLVARVTDTGGNPVADGTAVAFTDAEGKGTRVGTTGGVATAQVTAPQQPEQATITAEALGTSDSTTISFVQPTPAPAARGPALRLGANPNVLPADGRATATVSVLLLGPDDRPLAGKTVTLTTSAGSIAPTVTTDQAGRATATLTAGAQPAEAVVSAEAEGTVAAITVRFE